MVSINGDLITKGLTYTALTEHCSLSEFALFSPEDMIKAL